jgi:dCTP deaminase
MVYREDDVPLKFEPVSIDLHLGEVLLEDVIYKKGMILLKPGVFCLGSTIELFNMPPNVVGFIVGKSTIAREGIQIEAAGLVDPGFAGHVTLELKNLHHSEHITLIPGQPIGQVYFQYLDEPSDALYGYENGNHYQNQRGVTPSYRKKN